ncbi:MAG TPA: TonB-dependent receptor plug domain-containing protein [Gallionella sp.]|nr:TonB-dependent receptor plug domain-containing protein [Gallionella sp.]
MKLFRYRLSMAVLLPGVFCGSTWAAEYPTEQDYLQEFPIVLSASRLSQPISETPNAMTVIDRNMIVASGARNIADVFKLVPGMYVGYQNGHTPIVAYRGSTDSLARRMQVLVDGRSVYLPVFGQVDWVEFPVDITDIERIEVVRGPSAASHGSNSVQGVINILTHQASGVPKTQVSVSRGDAGISDISARLGSIGEDWDYRVALASHADNGFDGLYRTNIWFNNDSSAKQLINTRINYHPTGSHSFNIQLGYSDTSRGLGDFPAAQTGKGIATPLRIQKTLSDFQQITWLHTLPENNDVQLSYYHIGRNTKDDRYSNRCITCNPGALNVVAGLSYPINDGAVIHRHDLELQHTLNTSPDNRIVWGIGARQDSVNAPNILAYSPTWREYRLFGHDEWRITRSGLVNIGAMAEKNAQGKVRASPRISYNHHLSPRNTLRASVSVAYRNPEMIEEVGNHGFLLAKIGSTQYRWRDILSAGGLGPERALSREVGYIGQLDDNGSTLDLRAYHDQISNIIYLDVATTYPAADPGNVIASSISPRNFKSDFNATYTGLEGTLNYKFGERSKLTVNYAHQIAKASPSRSSPIAAFNPSLIGAAYNYRLTVPLNSASLLLSHDFSGGMQIGVGFYHMDPVQILDGAALQPLTRYLDLRVAQRFGGWRNKKEGAGGGEIAVVIQNVLNDHYIDYSTTIIGKRRAYLTATLGF